MTIRGERNLYHGIVLSRLVRFRTEGALVRSEETFARSAYLVDGEHLLLVKYSTKRMSPWPFVFTGDQVAEIHDLDLERHDLWLVLVCGMDGIATLRWGEAEDCLVGYNADGGFSLHVARRRGSSYRVSGSRNDPLVIADAHFPSVILGYRT